MATAARWKTPRNMVLAYHEFCFHVIFITRQAQICVPLSVQYHDGNRPPSDHERDVWVDPHEKGRGITAP
jgi:hypothetical protein